MNKPHALVLIHGIFDSSSVMKPLHCALEAQGFAFILQTLCRVMARFRLPHWPINLMRSFKRTLPIKAFPSLRLAWAG